jgi:alkanesulfonate monooxygenase SsuD/methylene tetrahydromethanopterin reductase-like flavin-dependent oxidoreductase (luciferase family)
MLRREIAAVQQEGAQPATTPVTTPLPSGGKTLYHYLLFWSHNGKWAERDWVNALGYVAAFHPTAGVSARDAAQAEYVTIVGGPAGVSKEVEEWLRSGGSKVERLSGKDEADTKRLLDELVQQGRRFQTFEE